MTFASKVTARAGAVLLALWALSSAAQAQPTCQGAPTGVKLRLVVTGVRSAKGVMTATLYGDDPHKFLRGRGELKVWRETATAPQTQMCMWLPAPGNYAVAVYHDSKNVGRFTQGLFGRPTQDFGFSRNPRIFLAPPSLASSIFAAPAGETTMTIKLRYP